ncbi:hypothetical protein ACGFX4_02665 [Kitasatospora sp. NPDC048365]|uniref:hypothetical protein n=1 Tax=Kitasatospora sp. NPDC048365 TaxID=3364050 RepID=UPI003721BC89
MAVRVMRGPMVLAMAAAAALGTTTGTAAALPSHADLQVVRLDPDPAAPGGLTTVHAFVANGGPDRTASPFTVLVDLPAGFTAEGPFFPENCTVSLAGHLVRCTFPAGLPALRTATALIPVRVNAYVPPGTRAEGHVRVAGADDTVPANDRTAFTLTVRAD